MRLLFLLLLLPLSSFGQIEVAPFCEAATVQRNGQQTTVQRCFKLRFDYNKPVLMEESLYIIDSLVPFFDLDSTQFLEVSCHRDTRGSDMYGQRLTQRRAQCVVEAFVQRGFPIELLRAKGYGEESPLISDEEIYSKDTKQEQEALHARNRRIEFVVLSR